MLPTLPILTTEEQQQLKVGWAAGAMTPAMQEAFDDLGMSESEQNALLLYLSYLEVGKWPEPLDITSVIAHQQQVNNRLIKDIPPLQNYLPLVVH